jgi:hypothetical protein
MVSTEASAVGDVQTQKARECGIEILAGRSVRHQLRAVGRWRFDHGFLPFEQHGELLE